MGSVLQRWRRRTPDAAESQIQPWPDTLPCNQACVRPQAPSQSPWDSRLDSQLNLSEDASPHSGFVRLWVTFMSARLLLALSVFGLHMWLHVSGRQQPAWLLVLCLVYVALTLLVRLRAEPRGQGSQFDAQWLATAGVDLVFYAILQTLDADTNYAALLVLPVLMTAVLGSRALALGTAALVAIVLLAYAVWRTVALLTSSADEMVQTGLIGSALLLLALLTNQLALWLAREEKRASRSQAEARMQSLVSAMVVQALSDGVLVVDAHGRVRTANPAALLMLGFEDPQTAPRGFGLDDNPAWLQLKHLARLTFRDGALDETEIVLRYEDHHSSQLQVRTQRISGLGHAERGLCVMFMQDLREMEARLRTEKLAAMGRMSAAVAHEIRNPLAAIVQANALLAEDLASPAQQRLTGMVAQNAQRLGNIVDDVLNIARVQDVTGEPAEPELLDLDEQVAVFCHEWAQQHQAGSRLWLDLKAAEVQVPFAQEHLRRILVNLLDNAARYATQRPAAIQVATRSARHGHSLLTVWSDGPPIEPTVRRHLFEPFFSSESRSSGLGLYICRELCGRHQASIGYERSTRAQGQAQVDGNEFFIHFKRMHGAPSAWHTGIPSQI